MSTENDSATILSDFVLSLDNLPSEMEHIMMEIRSKEQTIQELRNKAEQREIGMAKHHKANGLLAVNPKEQQIVQKLRSEYLKMQQLSDDKVRLAERAVAILTRHCGRFERELGRVQGGSLGLSVGASAASAAHTAPASPYTSMHSPSLATSTSSIASYTPSYAVGPTERSLKRKNAPSSLPTPTPAPLQPGPSTTVLISPLPTPTLPVLAQAQASRPARPSRLSTSFIGGAHSPPVSDGENRPGLSDPNRPLKRQKRRPNTSRRQMTPDEDEDAEGEEDEGEDASFENGDYSGTTADDKTLYCYCQRVSYGQMVGCDNPNCNYEWFHFECAGLKTQPEGAWYCKECSEMIGQAGGRRRNR